jgi:hypothetical protein
MKHSTTKRTIDAFMVLWGIALLVAMAIGNTNAEHHEESEAGMSYQAEHQFTPQVATRSSQQQS